ncbi:hypothetical protein CBA19CS22_05805 [Caballeronia novacaledonica]|uniref:Uncharacterized protein n=1 Tax=Caballeronia novacaledonica TaxID=1544861 RepID=A0ACB5QLG0_9BURK|nr:hypothetical protein CBA19CS22_05805 [Caballeronia novacaledonica]
MSESWIPIVIGIAVMLVATVLIAQHYRREQRRQNDMRKWQEPFQEIWRCRESHHRH